MAWKGKKLLGEYWEEVDYCSGVEMWLGASEGSFGTGRIFRVVEERVPAGTAGAPVGHTLVLGLSPLPCGGGSPRTEVAAWAQVYCSAKLSGGFSKSVSMPKYKTVMGPTALTQNTWP